MWPDNESVGLSVCGVLGKSIYFMTPAANLTITVVLCFALSYKCPVNGMGVYARKAFGDIAFYPVFHTNR